MPKATTSPPFASIVGSGILAISVVGLACYAFGVTFSNTAQVFTASAAILAAYRWL